MPLVEKKIDEGRITFKKPTKRVADGKTKEEEEAEEKKRKIEKVRYGSTVVGNILIGGL